MQESDFYIIKTEMGKGYKEPHSNIFEDNEDE